MCTTATRRSRLAQRRRRCLAALLVALAASPSAALAAPAEVERTWPAYPSPITRADDGFASPLTRADDGLASPLTRADDGLTARLPTLGTDVAAPDQQATASPVPALVPDQPRADGGFAWEDAAIGVAIFLAAVLMAAVLERRRRVAAFGG
jgi:hypothetical protein